jgi:hypothetical protein
MQRLLIVALAMSCGTAPVSAGELSRGKIGIFERPAYDRKLEQAVMRIVAGRIGEIRGPLATDMGPLLVALGNERARATDASSTPPAPPARQAAYAY